MAQLKSTVVQGSLRVTDTVNTTNLNLSSATASKIVKTDANKNLIAGALIASEIPAISITAGTTGTLTIARGGTGLNSSPSMLTNLATTATANVLQANPRPGVTGTLPISNGGTGLTSTSPNFVFSGTSTGTASAAPSWRKLVNADLPVVDVSHGGTGVSSFTANSVVISGTSTTEALSSISIIPGAFFSTTAGTATFDILPIGQGGTGVSSAADHFVLIGTTTAQTNSLQWRNLLGYDLQEAIICRDEEPGSLTGESTPVQGTIWMRPTSVTIEELKCYVVPINNFTGTATYNNSNITNDMVVINHEFSDPTVVIGDITWDTTTGSLVLTGSIADQESTNITLYLLKSRGT